MCLCLFAIDQHAEYPFVLLANRDEFRKRPTEKAGFWKDHPQVLAGRDLEQMGTWLGVTQQGRIAFLTNYRHPEFFDRKGPSRGNLVSGFLTSTADPQNYLKRIESPENYNGFNLAVGSPDKLYYYSNVEQKVAPIESGVHGLSNAFLNTPWAKVEDGKTRLGHALSANSTDADALFHILSDRTLSHEKDLPETGVGIELERLLSAKFINTPQYGTVCSTVIRINRQAECFFEERSFGADGTEIGRMEHTFDLNKN